MAQELTEEEKRKAFSEGFVNRDKARELSRNKDYLSPAELREEARKANKDSNKKSSWFGVQ